MRALTAKARFVVALTLAIFIESGCSIQTCYRDYTDGVLYRGTTSRGQNYPIFSSYKTCQKWTDTIPNSHSYTDANYPNTGLGDHNYCRNPDVSGSRTRPWCYYKNTQGWGYCWEVSSCSDSNCYSVIDEGGSYSGDKDTVNVGGTTYDCMTWSDAYQNADFSNWAALKTALRSRIFSLWGKNDCRNINYAYDKPWCYYKSGKTILNATCDLPKCNDVGVVSQTCGGNGGGSACVFPFKYKGFTFINCTAYEKNATWCATETDSKRDVTKWGYCDCPATPTTQVTTMVITTAAATTEATTTQVATTVAATTQAATTQAATTQAATTQAATTQTATTQGATTNAATTNAATTNAATTETATTEAATTQAATTQTATTQTATTEAATTGAATTEAATTKVVATEAVTSQITQATTTQAATTQAATTPQAETTQAEATTTQAAETTQATTSQTGTTPSEISGKTQSFTTETSTADVSDQTTTTSGQESARPGFPTSAPVTTEILPSTTPRSSQPQEQKSTVPLAMYVGASVGGTAVILVAVILLVIFCRKKNRSKDPLVSRTDSSIAVQGATMSMTNPAYREYENVAIGVKPKKSYASTGPEEEAVELEAETQFTCIQSKQAVVLSSRESQYNHLQPASAQVVESFYEPASTEEGLYGQFESQKLRRIHREDLILKHHLGSGEFGNVEKAIWKTGMINKEVAVKTLISDDKRDRVKFLKEAALMGQFRHQNIVGIEGTVTVGEPLMIVVEFMAMGDMKKVLVKMQNSDGTGMPVGTEKKLLKWTKEIAAGMKYLSKKGFVHRDLAARNVMLNENLVAKIGDFGLSRDLDESNYYLVSSKTKVPVRWTAPEAINFKKYSTASDVWSFGIVLYEIWSVGQRPYGFTKNADVVARVEEGHRLPPPPGCPKAIYTIMIDCWHPDKSMRPTFSQLVSRLSVEAKKLLLNGPRNEQIPGELGGPIESSTAPVFAFVAAGFAVYHATFVSFFTRANKNVPVRWQSRWNENDEDCSGCRDSTISTSSN
ncbi:uncharacterized protein [Oscarella lobularis]|uniref:uncharacterized protein isoform X2 n=1 Tax=Oscarella lobularis TaxID=121494 RepID=UPI003313DE88